MPELKDLLKVFGYDPIIRKKTVYEIQFPSICVTLEARDKKEALKKAKQGIDDIVKYFLLTPKYWKTKKVD